MNTAPLAIIADDEPHLANYLRDQLATLWPELHIAGIARNGPEALKLIDDIAPHIVFLDIRMPGLTGLEVASRLDSRTHVVFVTAFDQYAVEAFDREAADYLLKPVQEERLARTIAKLKDKLAKNEVGGNISALLKQWVHKLSPATSPYLRWIRASSGDIVRQIDVEDILYFQAKDKYISVYTAQNESLIRTPLAELASQLNPNEFWQIHRSIIVNVNHIAATQRDLMGRTQVQLKNCKTELPVSRAYVHLFRQM